MTFQDNTNIYFLLEYMPETNLSEFIQEEKLGENQARNLIAEIIKILEILQNKGIVHRDLKPENLMFDSCNHLKLIDFGAASIFKLKNKNNDLYNLFKETSKRFKKKYLKEVSFFLEENERNLEEVSKNWRLKETVGTSYYISPESINCSDLISGCDFWSLGVIVYKMLTGFYPFTGQNQEEIFHQILNRQFFMPPYLSDTAKDLINRLLVVDPLQRLGNGKLLNTFQDLKNHAFFKEVNFDKIYQKNPLLAIKNKSIHLKTNSNNSEYTSSFAFDNDENEILLSTETKYRKFFLFWTTRKIILLKNGKLIIKKNNIIEKEILINKKIRFNSFKTRIMIGVSIFNSYDFNFNKRNFKIWHRNLKKFF